MAFEIEKIKQLAYLTKVALTSEEAEQIAQELDVFVREMSAFVSVDTEGVEPLYAFGEEAAVLRDDVVTVGGIAQSVVKGAPEKSEDGDGAFFVVPRVVE